MGVTVGDETLAACFRLHPVPVLEEGTECAVAEKVRLYQLVQEEAL